MSDFAQKLHSSRVSYLLDVLVQFNAVQHSIPAKYPQQLPHIL